MDIEFHMNTSSNSSKKRDLEKINYDISKKGYCEFDKLYIENLYKDISSLEEYFKTQGIKYSIEKNKYIFKKIKK